MITLMPTTGIRANITTLKSSIKRSDFSVAQPSAKNVTIILIQTNVVGIQIN